MNYILPLLALKKKKQETFDQFLAKIEKLLPLYGTPKIDFIRCTTYDTATPTDLCIPKTRSGKDIANWHIRENIRLWCPSFIDGEVGAGKTFQDGSSAVMSRHGEPDFRYWVFDAQIDSQQPYLKRIDLLERLHLPNFCIKLIPRKLSTLDEVLKYETDELNKGAEGIMLRPGDSLYNTFYADNRSTWAKPYLIALKRMVDGEAQIIGFEEAYENQNEQTADNKGRMKRAHLQEFMFPKNMLGAFIVKDLKTGVEFRVGSGFTQDFARLVWGAKANFLGKIIRYHYQQCGTKDKPRIPIFDGIRDASDMS